METRQETELDPNRRLLLKVGAFGAISALAGVLLPRDENEIDSSTRKVDNVVPETREEFQARILNAFTAPEALPVDAQLIPECERTGSDILIVISSKNGEIDSALRDRWDALLRAFPESTHVHVVTAGKAETFVQSKLRPKHNQLQFSVYPLPFLGFQDDEIFAQDLVFATGSRDSDGRFQLLTSLFDHSVLTQERRKIHKDSLRFQQIGSELLIDEVLAERYQRIFKTHPVAMLCEGGDIEITRLPDGKSALVLGSSIMARMVCYLAAIMTKQTRKDYAMSVEEMFRATEEYYRKVFGVEKVIVLNPRNVLRICNSILQGKSSFFPYPAFYHQDMIVRPTIDPKGRHVAFCTTIDSVTTTLNPGDELVLQHARAKFASLGYEIVDLPCGIEPAQNYTNVQMFTPIGGLTNILLPQYGHEFDSVARRRYEERGYNIIPVDFSGQDPDDFSGSVHCLTEVLA